MKNPDLLKELQSVILGEYTTKIGSGSTPRGGANVYLDSGEISLIRSQNVHNDGFKSNGLVYITDDAAKKLDGVTIEENDILLNITGDSVARVCLVPKWVLPARVNQHVAIIRVQLNEFDSRYVRYYLSSPIMQDYLLGLAASGATRNALTKVMIEKLEVQKPELSEQKRIADILSSLDDKIALNREMNKTLESMAQAIFKSWFVDFEPFKEGEFVESELGMIPKGWNVKELREIGKVITGKTPKTNVAENFGDVYPFITPRDMSTEQHSLFTERYLSEQGKNSVKNCLLPKNSICVSCIGSDMGKVIKTTKPSITNQQINSIIVDEKIAYYDFIYYDLSSRRNELKTIAAGGTTLPIINKTTFEKLLIIMPPKKLLCKFGEIINPIDLKISNLFSEIQTLSSLRDTLLPKLLSGEIEV